MSDYSAHFVVRGKDVSKSARDYLSGLLGTERRKNMERIHGDIPESNYQSIQQFISDSPWNHNALMEQVAQDANGLLGGHSRSCLILDETTFIKKGNSSVGVQRQYSGRLGKTENCQMGVFACLNLGEKACVIDFRLFLPESWVTDAARCQKAQVPEDRQEYRSKNQLALEMVKAAKDRGVSFEWVLADAAYGISQEFRRAVEQLGYRYVMDVISTNRIWDANPEPKEPQRLGTSGRPSTRLDPTNPKAKKWKVGEWVAGQFPKKARELCLRKSSQGELRARVWVTDVWLWDEGSATVPEKHKLVAREHDDGEIKISLTNAPEEMSWEELAHMQAQRHWIERTFQDAKSELGMAQYEVRKWRGWHHHMALVSLAMLFVVKERIEHADSAPLLSARDIVELLDHYLPRRGGTEQEVYEDLMRRHRQRIQASISQARTQRKKRRRK